MQRMRWRAYHFLKKGEDKYAEQPEAHYRLSSRKSPPHMEELNWSKSSQQQCGKAPRPSQSGSKLSMKRKINFHATSFDIVEYYPWISGNVLSKALECAVKHVKITETTSNLSSTPNSHSCITARNLGEVRRQRPIRRHDGQL